MSSIIIIPLLTWIAQFLKLPLQKSDVHLKTYTEEPLWVVGEREVSCNTTILSRNTITVIASKGPSLLG